jgi:hypothetical protein
MSFFVERKPTAISFPLFLLFHTLHRWSWTGLDCGTHHLSFINIPLLDR